MSDGPAGPADQTGCWLLAGAIVSEVTGSMALRASVDHKAWIALVVAGYAAAFGAARVGVAAGMSVGVAYGI